MDELSLYSLAWLDCESVVHVIPILTFSDRDTAVKALEFFSMTRFATHSNRQLCVVEVDFANNNPKL